MHAPASPIRAILSLLLAVAMSACGPTRGDTGPSAAGPAAASAGEEAGVHRFIVKYRAGSAPAVDPGRVQARLDRIAGALDPEHPVGLAWQRRLAVEADVFASSRPLAPAEVERLLQRFAEDPDVEYIEVDGRMTIRPRAGIPPVRADGG